MDVVCLETENITSSEKYRLNNLESSIQKENKSQRRSGRIHIQNHYSDEDYNSNLSHHSSDKNIPTEDILLQEPSSSTAFKNSMNKRKRNSFMDTLGQVLTEIGLYDELYEFMKSRGITAEALKYMHTRHIDELFRGAKLSTKIIFEHKLKEWQNKNGTCEVTTTEANNANINSQGVQLLPQLNMPFSPSLNETEISFLSNKLTNAVQNAINKVLLEFKTPSQKSQSFDSYNIQLQYEVPNNDIVLKRIKTEPNLYSEEVSEPDRSYKNVNKKSNKLYDTSNDVFISSQSFESHETQSKRKKLNNDKSVHEILSAFQFGQRLVEEYKKNGVFTSIQRTELVRTVVDFYLRNNQMMGVNLCKRIAEEIVELFPTESLDFYFKQENKSKPPRGKIWEQYQTRKRSTRKINGLDETVNKIKIEKPIDTCDPITINDWSDMEAMCSEMKYIHDEKLLLEKWKDSFAFRRHQLQTGWFTNWKSFFENYPFCKQQNYAKFIESDLNTLHPSLKFNDYLWEEFMKHFSTFFSNRIKHPQSKVIFDQLIADDNLESNSDYVAIKVINLLHAVLKTYGKQLQSIEEAQRQFTVEVTDLSDLKKLVIERKKICADNNVQAKPYIAVVGDNKTYSHFSVILDSTGFSCDNYKDCLILCFNLYLFFELSFPYESLNVWAFIQQYFFNKPTLVNNPCVESFINDVNAQKPMIYENNIEIK